MPRVNEDDAFFFNLLSKPGVLAQKPITWVYSFSTSLLAGGNDFLGLQITVAAGCRADVAGLIGQLDVACVLVSVNRHRFDTHLAGREDDAAGDFTPVSD